MIRTVLLASVASLSLLACQQAEPAMPQEAEAAQADPAPIAEVIASDAAADAEAPAPATVPSVGGPPAGSRGEGASPRGPQTLEDMERRAEERFARLDTDNDGVVTLAEIEAAGGRGGRMLARSDADGDGRITRAEARAGTADMFRRMDANGDGVISEDERPQRGGPGGPQN